MLLRLDLFSFWFRGHSFSRFIEKGVSLCNRNQTNSLCERLSGADAMLYRQAMWTGNLTGSIRQLHTLHLRDAAERLFERYIYARADDSEN